jgi:hypothetical protein
MLSRRPIQLPPPGRNDCGPGGRSMVWIPSRGVRVLVPTLPRWLPVRLSDPLAFATSMAIPSIGKLQTYRQPRWRFPMCAYGEPALTSAGAADECAHQSRPELDCRFGKLTLGKLRLSNSLQRIARSKRQRHPLHEVAWARQKTTAKTRVANAAWKCETCQKSMGGKRCSRSSWPIAKRIGPLHGPWSCACSFAIGSRRGGGRKLWLPPIRGDKYTHSPVPVRFHGQQQSFTAQSNNVLLLAPCRRRRGGPTGRHCARE